MPSPARLDGPPVPGGFKLTEKTAATAARRTGVLVADEAMLVRAGLRAVIDAGGSAFHVIGEAGDGERALEAAQRLQPGLAVVGVLHAPLDTVALTARLRASLPGMPVVVLAPLDGGATLLGSLRAGAIGVLGTGVERQELLSALGRAVAGQSVVDPVVATALLTRMAGESDFAGPSLPDALTPRELEILRLVARGHTNREIAGRLILAVGTIKVHVEHILDKLGVHDRTQAAVRAVELGIAIRDDGEVAIDPRHRAA